MASQRIKGITIEIGGNTSQLVSALHDVDKAAQATRYNLNDINKALKLDPTNVNLLKDKQNELKDAVTNAKEKLDLEKQALEELKKQDGFDKNSKQAKDLQTQIDLDTVALKEAEKQLQSFGTVGGQVLQSVGKQMQELGDKIKAVGDKISEVGQGLTTSLTVPIATALGGAVKVTADFDSQMSKVKAISGATGDEFDQLREKAREMGASTKYSATEAGQAFEYMGMAGWKTEDMLNGISGIMNLAAASGEELGTTSDIVTDALTAFGLGAEDAGRFADILASAATNANTNVSMMGESFKYVAPVAGSLGYSAEDVAVALGLMANSGIKADMAGTSLRNMFQRMAKPTKESSMAMERLGLALADDEGNMYSFKQIMDQMRSSFSEINMSAEDYNAALDDLDQRLADGTIKQKTYDAELEELNKQAFGAEGAEKARAAAMLGGTRAMSGLLAIANATEDDYNKLTDAINNSSDSFARLADGSVVPLNEALASGAEIIETYNGQAEAMAATMQDNLTGDITVLKSMLQELAISLGDLMMPTLREIVASIQSLVDWLNNLDDSTKETIIQVALIVAAIGPALIVIGKVVSAVGTIVSAAGSLTSLLGGLTGVIAGISAPILAVVAAVAALAAGFVYLYQTNEEFRNKINELVEGVKANFTNMVETIKPAFEELFGTVKQIIGEVVDGFKKFIEEGKPVFEFIATGIAGVINGVMAAATPIVNTINSVIKTVVEVVKAMFALFTGDFKSFQEHAKNALINLLDVVKNLLTAKLSFFKGLFSTFGADIVSNAMQWGIDMINNLINGIQSMIGRVGDAIKSVADVISSYIHFSLPEKGPLHKLNTFMPDMMDQLSKGIINGIPEVESALDRLTSNMANDMQPNMSAQGANMAAGGVSNTTNTNTVNINVYGAQGQDVNELANKVQDIINNQIYSKGAVFA